MPALIRVAIHGLCRGGRDPLRPVSGGRISCPENPDGPSARAERPALEARLLVRQTAVGPAAARVVGHHQRDPHGAAQGVLGKPFRHPRQRVARRRLGAGVDEPVEHGRDVVGAHGVEQGKRQLQAAVPVGHRVQVGAKAPRAARHVVEPALDLQRRDQREEAAQSFVAMMSLAPPRAKRTASSTICRKENGGS